MDLLRWHVLDHDPWDDGLYRPLPGKENHALADGRAVVRLIERIAQMHQRA